MEISAKLKARHVQIKIFHTKQTESLVSQILKLIITDTVRQALSAGFAK